MIITTLVASLRSSIRASLACGIAGSRDACGTSLLSNHDSNDWLSNRPAKRFYSEARDAGSRKADSR